MQTWIEEELATSDFGDERLDKRFMAVMDCLNQKPSASIAAACGTWGEVQAAYRFFDNDRVDEHEVLHPHQAATVDRIAAHDVVLLAQDTTELDVTRPEKQMVGAGPLHDEFHIGFHDHAMLAVTPERIPLGVVGAKIWARDWDEVGSAEVLGTWEVEVKKNTPKAHTDRKRNQPRSARTAVLTIRATRVTLKGPYRPGGKLADLEINAVLVRETAPPSGEEPIEWLLLTSLPINTWKKVCLVIDYYCCRWQIEIYFRVLKSGCRVEELQLETAERFKPCLALYMIVAWRVMYVMMLGRECPEMSCDRVFSEDEWKSVYTVVCRKPAPKAAPTLEKMIYLIASLGGHLGRSCDGPPGPKQMWIGMQRMTDLARAWRTFGPPARRVGKRKSCV